MTIDEAGSRNEKDPNIEPSTGIQLHRDSCPGVSCTNSFAGLHLADETSQSQATDPPYEIPMPTGRIQAKDLPNSPLGRDKIKGPFPSPMKNFSGLCKLPYTPDPGAAPSESSVGHGALVCLDAPATVDFSPIEALGLADEHLNPCQPSPELVVDAPMHDSAQVEGVHKFRSSSVELSANSVDLNLTPNSIIILSCKYPRDASNTVEEVVDDEDDFHDPTLNALKKLLEANATEIYLDSLNLEGRQTSTMEPRSKPSIGEKENPRNLRVPSANVPASHSSLPDHHSLHSMVQAAILVSLAGLHTLTVMKPNQRFGSLSVRKTSSPALSDDEADGLWSMTPKEEVADLPPVGSSCPFGLLSVDIPAVNLSSWSDIVQSRGSPPRWIFAAFVGCFRLVVCRLSILLVFASYAGAILPVW
ncbi:hypothetical protein Nepgr_027708 [Nepenthes gracilis]|uniref:Uncharacterized protein n=1 Tax=Nepenthes gracilis TaxID=150966 RepID=A0AAD3T909_NEPGR|nr:hypothetical protein Nepgr_027708 [Nepenthes gracilis]